MLTVDDFELIRRKHYIDGMSGRAIAEELGHSRKTVAKALEHPVPPGYRLSEPRPKPVIEPVKPIIDAWLEEDVSRPRKQRHTAQRIYERLRDEHGFSGHPATVRRYVSQARTTRREVTMPLAFEPGEEGQVDWHEGWLIESGEWRKAQFFCMRLCYSKASFVWPYERATLEAFLDGHVRAFAYFGGVPRRLAYDNLASAVVQVGRGQERRLTERFKHLRSWYLFETRFCQPAKGNEKGDVENLAKRSERTYLTPVPEVGRLDELGPQLLGACDRDLELQGPAPHSELTRRQMLEQERAAMLPLPAEPFDACVQISTFVDGRSLVRVETNRYSAPVRWAHHQALVKLFADRVEIWCEHRKVAEHAREYARDQYVMTPEHYLALLRIKPGSLDNARAFKGQPWGETFELLRRELEYRYEADGTRQYIDVLLLMIEHPEQAVRDAVERCVKRRAFAYEAIVAALRNEPVRSDAALDLSGRPELMIQTTGMRELGVYDELLSDGEPDEEVAA